MDPYFKYAHVHEDDRVDHGVILLRDAAESWWRSHVVSTTDPQGSPTDGRLVTWAAFANCLKDVFTPIPEKERARSRLYDLKQTGSVQAYTALFREVTFVLDDLSPSEAFSLYKRGLKPKVWSDIRLQFPKMLEAVIALAEQADAEGSSVGPDRPTARSGAASGDRRPFIRRARQKEARLNVVEVGRDRRGAGAAVAAARPPDRRPPNADRQAAANGPAAEDRDRLRREGAVFHLQADRAVWPVTAPRETALAGRGQSGTCRRVHGQWTYAPEREGLHGTGADFRTDGAPPVEPDDRRWTDGKLTGCKLLHRSLRCM